MADGDNQGTNDGVTGAGDGNQAAPLTSINIADLKTAGLPETYFGQDGALNTKDLVEHLTDRTTLRTAAETRAAGVPADGKYDFSLPKDFALPEGMKVPEDTLKSWNVSDAKVAKFAEYAKANGIPQAEVTEFVRNWAVADLSDKMGQAKAQADAEKAATDAEIAEATKTLGANWKEVAANTRNAMQALFVEKIGKEAGERLAKNIGMQDATDVKNMLALVEALRGSKLATKQGGTDGKQTQTIIPGQARDLIAQANIEKYGN